jgi:hypothetical protein
LPDDCPKFMECPISQERMEDPVVAGDHHSYDRKFIQAWFDKGNTTSPLCIVYPNKKTTSPPKLSSFKKYPS